MKEEKPCSSCPWTRASQTPAAVAASPVDGRGRHWFSRANLARHWKGAASIGAMLPCHVSDANAPLYGGRPAARGAQAHICAGLCILARREVTAFMEDGTDLKRYRARPGRRFSATALAAWAARLYYAGAVFHMAGRTFTMPAVSDDASVTVPWRDSLHNRGEGGTDGTEDRQG